MFAHSRNLFRLSNGRKIYFIVLESSYDVDLVSRLIKWGGGSVSIKSEPMPNVINLSCKFLPGMEHFELFSTSYVYSSCRINQRKSLSEFSIGKYLSEKELKRLDEKYLSLPPTQDLSLSSTSVRDFEPILKEFCSKGNMGAVAESSQIGRTLQHLKVCRDSKEILPEDTNPVKKEESAIEEDSLTSCSATRKEMGIQLPLTFLDDKHSAMERETILTEIFPNDSASIKKCAMNYIPNSVTSSEVSCETIIEHKDEWKDDVAIWLGYCTESC